MTMYNVVTVVPKTKKNIFFNFLEAMSGYAEESKKHCDVVCEYLPSIVTRHLIQGINEKVKLPTESENGTTRLFFLGGGTIVN